MPGFGHKPQKRGMGAHIIKQKNRINIYLNNYINTEIMCTNFHKLTQQQITQLQNTVQSVLQSLHLTQSSLQFSTLHQSHKYYHAHHTETVNYTISQLSTVPNGFTQQERRQNSEGSQKNVQRQQITIGMDQWMQMNSVVKQLGTMTRTYICYREVGVLQQISRSMKQKQQLIKSKQHIEELYQSQTHQLYQIKEYCQLIKSHNSQLAGSIESLTVEKDILQYRNQVQVLQIQQCKQEYKQLKRKLEQQIEGLHTQISQYQSQRRKCNNLMENQIEILSSHNQKLRRQLTQTNKQLDSITEELHKTREIVSNHEKSLINLSCNSGHFNPNILNTNTNGSGGNGEMTKNGFGNIIQDEQIIIDNIRRYHTKSMFEDIDMNQEQQQSKKIHCENGNKNEGDIGEVDDNYQNDGDANICRRVSSSLKFQLQSIAKQDQNNQVQQERQEQRHQDIYETNVQQLQQLDKGQQNAEVQIFRRPHRQQNKSIFYNQHILHSYDHECISRDISRQEQYQPEQAPVKAKQHNNVHEFKQISQLNKQNICMHPQLEFNSKCQIKQAKKNSNNYQNHQSDPRQCIEDMPSPQRIQTQGLIERQPQTGKERKLKRTYSHQMYTQISTHNSNVEHDVNVPLYNQNHGNQYVSRVCRYTSQQAQTQTCRNNCNSDSIQPNQQMDANNNQSKAEKEHGNHMRAYTENDIREGGEKPNFKKRRQIPKQGQTSRLKYLITVIGGKQDYRYYKKQKFGNEKLITITENNGNSNDEGAENESWRLKSVILSKQKSKDSLHTEHCNGISNTKGMNSKYQNLNYRSHDNLQSYIQSHVDVDRAEIDRNKMYNIGGYYYKDGVKNSQVALDTKISNIIKNEKEKEAGPVRKSSIVASNGKKINGKTRV